MDEVSKPPVTRLPKGTIVHYRGFPCELLDDAKVSSASLPWGTTIGPQTKPNSKRKPAESGKGK